MTAAEWIEAIPYALAGGLVLGVILFAVAGWTPRG